MKRRRQNESVTEQYRRTESAAPLLQRRMEAVFGSMEPVTGAVVGALYNADTEGMKNILLHTNPAGVIAGLKIAALLTGAERAELVVNCEVNQQELEASAGIVELPQ